MRIHYLLMQGTVRSDSVASRGEIRYNVIILYLGVRDER